MSYISRWTPRNRYTPDEIHDQDAGLRPSMAKLLELIDVTEPSFAKTAAILSDMASAGVELDEAAIDIALKMSKLPDVPTADAEARARQRKGADLGLPLWGADANQHSIVYYIRRGALIKIGTTTRPANRFKDLVPDAILAFEPGDRRVETARHQQFEHLRKGGEYFTPGRPLTQHIERLRGLHGEPDEMWRTTANVGVGRPRMGSTHKAPTSTETVTVSEAARLINIPMPTVYGWVRRRKIRPVGMNERSRHLYYLEHFQGLASQAKRRPHPPREDTPNT